MRLFTPFITHLLILISILASNLGGCATIAKEPKRQHNQLLPPEYKVRNFSTPEQADEYFKNIATSTSLKGVKWWSEYRRAQAWKKSTPELSCQLFTQLGSQVEFPLRAIAFLRAKEICNSGNPELETVSAQYSDKNHSWPVWLEELQSEASLSDALRSNDQKLIMEHAIRKSKASLIRPEKVAFTEQALAIARNLKDKKSIQKFSKRLNKLAPSRIKKPKRSEFLAVALDHRRNRDFNMARKYYNKVVASKHFSFRTKTKALKGIRTSYKNERKMDDYMRATEKLARHVYRHYKKRRKNKSAIRLQHKTQITLARTYWTLSHLKKAKSILKNLPKQLRKKYSMDEVYWLRGRMLEERQNFGGAVWWFERALKEKSNSNDLKEKLKWYLAWNYRKLSRFPEAIKQLDELKESTTNPYARAKYFFWMAKSHQEAGATKLAKAAFSELIIEDPIGFYGLLSHKELGLSLKHPVFSKKSHKEAKPRKDLVMHDQLVDLLDPVYGKWLIAVDEQRIAKHYLDHISKSYRKQHNQSQHAWLTLFNYYAQAGIFLDLFTQLGQIDSDQRKSILDIQPELVFPMPFKETVSKASKDFSISSEFLYAIMRQESAFNPRARSHADAFGLMQLLPEIAERSAPVIGLEYKKPEDLYLPTVNINIGAHFLGKLWTQYDGRFILATAAYNASDRAIRGWLQTRYRGNTLEFIEDIPYEETRGYVKLVMRNMIFYSILNANGKPIEFPSWALEMGAPDA